jgi:hypothetical protein
MKKRRISINYQDGDDQPENGNSIPDNSYAGGEIGQYAILEVEVDRCLKDEETELFRKTLIKVHNRFVEEEKEVYNTTSRILISRSYAYAIAASIALLIGVFSVLYFISGTQNSNYQKIFVKYYVPYENEYITRSDQLTINTLFIAFHAYENRDYSKAVELFANVIESDRTLLMAYFYKGVSCIEINDLKGAMESLKMVLKNETNPYYAQAKWYTALTLLKLNSPVIAKKHLEWLALNDRYYGNKAKEILKLLDK